MGRILPGNDLTLGKLGLELRYFKPKLFA
jgi:hypothetical protein